MGEIFTGRLSLSACKIHGILWEKHQRLPCSAFHHNPSQLRTPASHPSRSLKRLLLGLAQMERKGIAKKKKKNLFFHAWFTSTLNLLIFMKGKIHESKGNAWLSGRGNEHLHVQTSKRHVLHFYKYFKPIPAIWNIIKHLQLHSIFNSMTLFSHFPKKPFSNTGPGVTVSKKNARLQTWQSVKATTPLCILFS